MCEPNVLCDWLIPCLLQHCDLLLTWRIDFVSLHSFCSLLLGGGWFEKQENATNVFLKKKKMIKNLSLYWLFTVYILRLQLVNKGYFCLFLFFVFCLSPVWVLQLKQWRSHSEKETVYFIELWSRDLNQTYIWGMCCSN